MTERLNTWLLWGLMLLLMALDAIGLHLAGMSVKPTALGATIFHVLCMVLLTLFYTFWRKDRRIASLAHSIAVFLAFSSVTIVMSYLTVVLRRPLIDEHLVAVDRALGFDWLAQYHWVMAHPLVEKILFIGYASLIPQLIVLTLLLNFMNMRRRCWEMIWLFMSACIACLIFSALWPAAGAFGYFGLEGEHRYVQIFMKLYNNSLRVIGEEPVDGIIQFPSLHIALAVIYAYAARGIRYVFPFFIAMNTLLLISTPAIGGHHLIDVLAGALMAVLLIAAGRLISRRV